MEEAYFVHVNYFPLQKVAHYEKIFTLSVYQEASNVEYCYSVVVSCFFPIFALQSLPCEKL
jgi:hypothetical protein